MMAEVRG
jgi:hypothetical protein